MSARTRESKRAFLRDPGRVDPPPPPEEKTSDIEKRWVRSQIVGTIPPRINQSGLRLWQFYWNEQLVVAGNFNDRAFPWLDARVPARVPRHNTAMWDAFWRELV